jgi:hypothetical protein
MDTTQPFRFKDLPGKIRNKIYKLLLCSFESFSEDDNGQNVIPVNLTPLRDSVQTEILLVNKAIREEARHEMSKNNLFIMVEIAMSFSHVSQLFILGRHPILLLGADVANYFKDAVMVHKIGYDFDKDVATIEKGLIFLARDLPVYVATLQENG